MKRRIKRQLSPWKILALGFACIILTGTLLLCLPFSSIDTNTTFINALFTATSATCVTGLVPYDTATHWTVFGQTVILLMIQLGGLGFMTFITLVFQALGKQMSVSDKKLAMLVVGNDNRNSTYRIIRRVLLGTLLFELSGAIILSTRFIDDFGFGKGLYFAVFHSVSAFCNAGFDLMGGSFGSGAFTSLTHYVRDPLVCLTIACLIIMGGIGFCVWDDAITTKFRWKYFKLHTKIVLVSTLLMLAVSTASYVLFDWNNAIFDGYSFGERLLVGFFNATTTRTAGFNTIDFSSLSDASYFLSVSLMFIGGSSASTAGGIKLTTFVVIVTGIASVFSGKHEIELGKRRIDQALIRQALAIFVSCLAIVVIATMAVCAIEVSNPSATFQAVLFETVSAMATVGLSLSLTPTLSTASKLILILLMYIGRVGVITIGLAFAEKTQTTEIKRPIENILIG
ncbi:MAG: Trk family potassium uptake protein [Clostridia bacterium]|nr:Trk family potassium uptake protein [Clostridia bacterium]